MFFYQLIFIDYTCIINPLINRPNSLYFGYDRPPVLSLTSELRQSFLADPRFRLRCCRPLGARALLFLTMANTWFLPRLLLDVER